MRLRRTCVRMKRCTSLRTWCSSRSIAVASVLASCVLLPVAVFVPPAAATRHECSRRPLIRMNRCTGLYTTCRLYTLRARAAGCARANARTYSISCPASVMGGGRCGRARARRDGSNDTCMVVFVWCAAAAGEEAQAEVEVQVVVLVVEDAAVAGAVCVDDDDDDDDDTDDEGNDNKLCTSSTSMDCMVCHVAWTAWLSWRSVSGCTCSSQLLH